MTEAYHRNESSWTAAPNATTGTAGAGSKVDRKAPPIETDQERRLLDESIHAALAEIDAGNLIDMDVVVDELDTYIDSLPDPASR